MVGFQTKCDAHPRGINSNILSHEDRTIDIKPYRILDSMSFVCGGLFSFTNESSTLPALLLLFSAVGSPCVIEFTEGSTVLALFSSCVTYKPDSFSSLFNILLVYYM